MICFFLSLSGCSSSETKGADEAAPLPLEVKTIEGSVRGTTHADSPDVRVFRGIPYAAPPIGANRWRKPQAGRAVDRHARGDFVRAQVSATDVDPDSGEQRS